MSQESALNFDQWEKHSENYKPIGVFVYKITENNRRLGCYTEFIQTQKSYPTSLYKISILTWTTCHIKSKFFLWTKLLKNLLFTKYLISVTAALRIPLLEWMLIYGLYIFESFIKVFSPV